MVCWISKMDIHLNFVTTATLSSLWKLRNPIIFKQATLMDLAYPKLACGWIAMKTAGAPPIDGEGWKLQLELDFYLTHMDTKVPKFLPIASR